MSAGLQIIDAGGTDRTLSAFEVIDAGGVDRTITEARVIDAGGVDRVIWSPGGSSSTLAVAVTPGSASATSRYGSGATTNSVTAYGSGGTAPYKYAWSLVDSDGDSAPVLTAPSSATTAFKVFSMPRGSFETATFRVTVTDSATPTPATGTAEVYASWSDVT